MRVTTQMLNESARRAGLPVNNVSLLNYINGNDSGNSLLNALNEKNNSAVNTVKKSSYEKLEKAADQLAQRGNIFVREGEESIFEKARASESNEEIYSAVQAFVESYNSTMKALGDTSGTLNDFYRENLLQLVNEKSGLLETVGITLAKDGTMNLDVEKLKTADTDTLEQIFGTGTDFMKKVSYLAGRIADNAGTNAESLTSQYTANGNTYTASASKYDFWG